MEDFINFFDDEQLGQLVALLGCTGANDVMDHKDFLKLHRYCETHDIDIPGRVMVDVEVEKVGEQWRRQGSFGTWVPTECGGINFD